VLALSTAAYAQYPDPVAREAMPAPGESKPDTSGQRLRQLLRSAQELEQTGKQQEASQLRAKAEKERQALLAHVDSLQAEADRIHQIAGGARQVMVHLKVFEVSLTKLRRLGYNLAKMQGKTVTSPDAAQGAVLGGFSMIDDGSEASRFLEAMRKDNLAKVLAEPILVTTSGNKATFNAGGQFPIPKPQNDGSTTMEWEHYGTQVQLMPRLLADDTVRLTIHFRAADLDRANSAQIGKDTVPGLRVREFSTTAELHEGQTLAFSGLNQVRVETTESGVPVASSIPYIGSAFKNVKEERNEIAVFVLVRPEIVKPLSAATDGESDAPRTAQPPCDYDTRR
jgi:pilus assembly protein CpaC